MSSVVGFVYLRNRWYDPKTGRFLTQDPIGLAGGVNLYAYAGNNPIAFSDPFGLAADSIRFVSADAEAKFNSAVGKMRTCLKSCDYVEAVKAGIGLAILDAAKASTKDIYIRMQRPVSRDISDNQPCGSTCRMVSVDPNEASYRSFATSEGAMIHETIEGYNYLQTQGNPPANENDGLYPVYHGRGISFGEDPVYSGSGLKTRTSRTPIVNGKPDFEATPDNF